MRTPRLLGRLLIGGLFFAHGTQKLFGWFGGPGLRGTSQMMEKIEMHPARPQAIAAGSAETIGGLGIALGALTPAAAGTLIATMVTAIRRVHFEKGFFNTDGGYEFNLTLIAALLLITDSGPGPLSVDFSLGRDRAGPRWALAALAAGSAGSQFAIALSARFTPSAEMQGQDLESSRVVAGV